jgi:hypothetical protein
MKVVGLVETGKKELLINLGNIKMISRSLINNNDKLKQNSIYSN